MQAVCHIWRWPPRLGIIGSANLDNRSFRLNFEVVAVIFGTDVNETLAGVFAADLHGSRELDEGLFEAQPFPLRLGQATARLISPLL